jgi:hypothetical protein
MNDVDFIGSPSADLDRFSIITGFAARIKNLPRALTFLVVRH